MRLVFAKLVQDLKNNPDMSRGAFTSRAYNKAETFARHAGFKQNNILGFRKKQYEAASKLYTKISKDLGHDD